MGGNSIDKILCPSFGPRLCQSLGPNSPCKVSIEKFHKFQFIQVSFSKKDLGHKFGSKLGHKICQLNCHPGALLKNAYLFKASNWKREREVMKWKSRHATNDMGEFPSFLPTRLSKRQHLLPPPPSPPRLLLLNSSPKTISE